MQSTDLAKIAASYLKCAEKVRHRVIVCAGTGCIASGSLKVLEALKRECAAARLSVEIILKEESTDGCIHVSESGCQGFCQMGPLVTIPSLGLLYCKVMPEDALVIVRETLLHGRVVERLLYKHPTTGERFRGQDDIPFYKRQKRFVLKECGLVDPNDVREYIAKGGYRAALKAYLQMSDKEICDEMIASGLRGRGGGGFPTGRKWELTRVQPGPDKFVICNGDEGDPGAFMDRSVMEGNPHAVIEGMLIAAKAIGANKGVVYVRAEYPLAVRRIRAAVAAAEKLGFLGQDVFGSGLSFEMEVMEGAGAFVCGEETALMSSVEGSRGMPRPKPPFPAESGLWGKPTVINNVETLATVPLILLCGSAEFRKIGTPSSPGTKTFALTGHVANTGLIEVPFGTTLREIIMDIGGGVVGEDGTINNDLFKAVQIGGPSGGCLVAQHLDTPLDFDSLAKMGAMVGSGGLVVMNRSTCIIGIARFFMQFTQNESCGKCVPCREGTRQMLCLLDDIVEGRGTADTIADLRRLSRVIGKASLCGLGKTAPNPVLSTLQHFGDEYAQHVHDKFCEAKRCKALLKPEIEPLKCKGCTLCKKKCPVDAIEGEVRKAHVIDGSKCIRCGACASVCKFQAIKGVSA